MGQCDLWSVSCRLQTAVDFVDYCLQNAAFLAGQTVIADEIGII